MRPLVLSAANSFFLLFLRLQCAVKEATPDELKANIRFEIRLLLTYNVSLPGVSASVTGRPDPVSSKILELLDPNMLNDSIPLFVIGDGNCLFRALSKALYNTEKHHAHLCLLTALEVAFYPSYYDSSATNYQDLILDR